MGARLTRFSGAALALALAPVLAPGSARAADVKVRVTDDTGQGPLAGAAVCLGTPANHHQMGAYLTPASGMVTFSGLLKTPLVLTVSRSGYQGERIDLEPSGSDRVLLVPLTSGGGGPVCSAATATPGSAGALNVSDFRIDAGADRTAGRRVNLSFTVSGTPTQYRVSEHADFAGARWQPYRSRPTFELSAGPGTKTVYLQVRRFRQLAGHSTLQITSNVVHDSIVLGGS
ncbi:MAG TPA: carboxypeptidase regulatory-like domain-containing protein [Gammaproteobacteria bacterium]|nr:carboxypeptidase regulatory-like domain-containing protein [Gammaproteobacteria bacterium]